MFYVANVIAKSLNRPKTTFSKQVVQVCAIRFQQIRSYGVRDKIVDIEDAVALVKNGDSICVSGFVAQSCPEALLRSLGDRFDRTGEPKDLKILFGGGPGDFSTKGVNHFARPGMIQRSIGSHYGQVPLVAKRVLDNEFPGYALPLGAISRLYRQTASNSPGYITKVGLNTFVDPRQTGGALNDLAKKYPVVELIELDGQKYLRYFPIAINVAFIRATTADTEGNLTMEHESILGDVKIQAMAAKSSGGVVIAQVERVCAYGSLPSRSVHVPGTFVDCVVVADKSEHPTSYFTQDNPVWCGEIREPTDNLQPMDLNVRKIIARRASFELRLDDIVNLGIGMPEGVASIASEEGIFNYVTLTTEAGVIGGVGAGGHDFGPGSNPDAFNEMHQQFDLYNGGGLSVCFLGLAECDGEGNVNVSRLSENSLTGPGGFIDISQCTRRVVFMGTFTKKGMKAEVAEDKLVINREGSIHTFKKDVREVSFAAKQAILNGQKVLYITERCVFELNYRGLKLMEIAPGIDLEKDILAHMDVKPYFKDASKIKTMDKRIFNDAVMNLHQDLFSLEKQFKNRVDYFKDTHTCYLDLRNFIVTEVSKIDEVEEYLDEYFKQKVKAMRGEKLNLIINYDGFDCKSKLTENWAKMAKRLEKKYYGSVKRYSGHIFRRQKMANQLGFESDDDFWRFFVQEGKVLSRPALVSALNSRLNIRPKPEIVDYLMDNKDVMKRTEFGGLLNRLNYYRQHGFIKIE